MAIDGIGRYAGLQTYAPREITRVTPEEVLKQDKEKQAQSREASSQLPSYSEPEQRRAERATDLQDVSLSFRKNDDTYPGIGRDVSLEALDAEKNISEMSRDRILSGYRFFAGDFSGTPSVTDQGLGFVRFSSEDGAVVAK